MLFQDHHIPILKAHKLIKSAGLDLFSTFDFQERLKIFLKKKKSSDDWFEFISALFGGFRIEDFGNRAKILLNKSSYDVVIDNQSLSYGMIEIQKNTIN